MTAAWDPRPAVWEALTTAAFLCKLETLRNFLQLCRAASLAFRADTVGTVLPTGAALLAPVTSYLTEFLQLQLLGTAPPQLGCAVLQLAGQAAPQASQLFLQQAGDSLQTGDLCQVRQSARNCTAVVWSAGCGGLRPC